MEKRGKKRFLKRLFVRFGDQKPDHCAFTHDLSSTGIFLKTTTIFLPNTTLHIDLTLREGSFLRYFRNERGMKRGDVKKIKGILPLH